MKNIALLSALLGILLFTACTESEEKEVSVNAVIWAQPSADMVYLLFFLKGTPACPSELQKNLGKKAGGLDVEYPAPWEVIVLDSLSSLNKLSIRTYKGNRVVFGDTSYLETNVTITGKSKSRVTGNYSIHGTSGPEELRHFNASKCPDR